MIRDDPETSARALATELHAELAVGGEETEAALGRLPRGERQVPQPVVAQSDPGRPDFEQLSRAMRRAEEIRDRTRRGVAEQLSRTFNTALAIHPDTIRRAAAALVDAQASLGRAQRGRHPTFARKAQRIRAGGIGCIAAAGLAIGALGAVPVGALVAAVGVAGAGINLAAGRRNVRASLPALEGSQAVARRRWEQLAGIGADPVHAEAVIHRYDPQHRVITDLLINNPAVRAADRLALHHRMAWVQAWRVEVGDDSPISAAVEPASHPVPALKADATADRSLEPPRTLIVAGPYTELSEDRARALHRRLLTLPGGNRVIVVLGPDAMTARPTMVDLRDPVADQHAVLTPDRSDQALTARPL